MDFVGPVGARWGLAESALPRYDVSRARQLLAEAGYPNGFTAALLTSPGAAPGAENVAVQLQQAGIRLTIAQASTSDYQRALVSKEYAMAAGVHAGRPRLLHDPAFALRRYVTGDQDNVWGLQDPSVDELYTRARYEVDPVKRKAMSDEAQRRLFEVVPAIPLPEDFYSLALRPYVRGWTTGTLLGDAFRLDKVWLDSR